MSPEQLELNFDGSGPSGGETGNVVAFHAFAAARTARLQVQEEQEKAILFRDIIKSVEHITGRSPDAEAM